jgi:membrane protein YdbS with pleckstrin-like domain
MNGGRGAFFSPPLKKKDAMKDKITKLERRTRTVSGACWFLLATLLPVYIVFACFAYSGLPEAVALVNATITLVVVYAALTCAHAVMARKLHKLRKQHETKTEKLDM